MSDSKKRGEGGGGWKEGKSRRDGNVRIEFVIVDEM